MAVRDVIKAKGHDVFSIGPDASVFDALTLMADKNIGAVLVVDGERTLGIFTERDYSRQVVLKGRASRETPVRDVMTARVVYVTPDQSMDDCMAIMTSKRCRHLPVVEAGQLVGVLSVGDVVKAVISDKQFLIEQLENYITSGG